ncbi:MAG: ABC transporter permease [Clostridiales bacterium]|nr:ABC transporter permease [Clostridiales bacterium]
MKIFKDLYNYRELLKTSVKKDIGGKYKHSFLGVLWSFINPLLQILVYALIFPLVMKNGGSYKDYTVFMVCGLIPWAYFTTVINRASFIMIENGNILKKVYFPRSILPLSLVTSETINFLVSCIIILAFIVIKGFGISKFILFFTLVLLIQYVLLLGIALIFSAVTVYMRDIQHFIGVVLQLLFYATPIVYSIDTIPENFRWILKWNPMTYIIEGYRAIFYNQTMPDLKSLGVLGIISIIILIVGYLLFNKLQKRFAEEL